MLEEISGNEGRTAKKARTNPHAKHKNKTDDRKLGVFMYSTFSATRYLFLLKCLVMAYYYYYYYYY